MQQIFAASGCRSERLVGRHQALLPLPRQAVTTACKSQYPYFISRIVSLLPTPYSVLSRGSGRVPERFGEPSLAEAQRLIPGIQALVGDHGSEKRLGACELQSPQSPQPTHQPQPHPNSLPLKPCSLRVRSFASFRMCSMFYRGLLERSPARLVMFLAFCLAFCLCPKPLRLFLNPLASGSGVARDPLGLPLYVRSVPTEATFHMSLTRVAGKRNTTSWLSQLHPSPLDSLCSFRLARFPSLWE